MTGWTIPVVYSEERNKYIQFRLHVPPGPAGRFLQYVQLFISFLCIIRTVSWTSKLLPEQWRPLLFCSICRRGGQSGWRAGRCFFPPVSSSFSFVTHQMPPSLIPLLHPVKNSGRQSERFLFTSLHLVLTRNCTKASSQLNEQNLLNCTEQRWQHD